MIHVIDVKSLQYTHYLSIGWIDLYLRKLYVSVLRPTQKTAED